MIFKLYHHAPDIAPIVKRNRFVLWPILSKYEYYTCPTLYCRSAAKLLSSNFALGSRPCPRFSIWLRRWCSFSIINYYLFFYHKTKSSNQQRFNKKYRFLRYQGIYIFIENFRLFCTTDEFSVTNCVFNTGCPINNIYIYMTRNNIIVFYDFLTRVFITYLFFLVEKISM